MSVAVRKHNIASVASQLLITNCIHWSLGLIRDRGVRELSRGLKIVTKKIFQQITIVTMG